MSWYLLLLLVHLIIIYSEAKETQKQSEQKWWWNSTLVFQAMFDCYLFQLGTLIECPTRSEVRRRGIRLGSPWPWPWLLKSAACVPSRAAITAVCPLLIELTGRLICPFWMPLKIWVIDAPNWIAVRGRCFIWLSCLWVTSLKCPFGFKSFERARWGIKLTLAYLKKSFTVHSVNSDVPAAIVIFAGDVLEPRLLFDKNACREGQKQLTPIVQSCY